MSFIHNCSSKKNQVWAVLQGHVLFYYGLSQSHVILLTVLPVLQYLCLKSPEKNNSNSAESFHWLSIFLKHSSQTSRHILAQEGFRKIRYLTRPSRIDTRSTETSTSLMSALLQVCDTVWHRVTPRSYLNLSSSYTGQTKETLECVPVAVSTLLQVVELGRGGGGGGGLVDVAWEDGYILVLDHEHLQPRSDQQWLQLRRSKSQQEMCSRSRW